MSGGVGGGGERAVAREAHARNESDEKRKEKKTEGRRRKQNDGLIRDTFHTQGAPYNGLDAK